MRSFTLPLLSLLASAVASPFGAGRVSINHDGPRKCCTVHAHGGNVSDVDNILKAFDECGNGGDIIFPEDQNYFIASKMNPVVNDVRIDWRGIWTVSPDIDYWRTDGNTYYIAFQNHRTNFILTGDHITINGFGTGGIEGNGDTWYTAEAGKVRVGRPMPFVLWNVSDVYVNKFFVKQPAFWAFNIMNGTDIVVDEFYANATATKNPYGANWVPNTDGFDTMDARNVTLRNFIYQGGDDCIAIKPRSYEIHVTNVTCRGGNGIAIGSVGQYLEDSSVENVTVSDVTIERYNEDMGNPAYIKTWVGILTPQNNYESGGLPRGGGTGVVRNLTFSNFYTMGADGGPAITQDSGSNGSTTAGTSKMEVSNIEFRNFTGYLSGKGSRPNRMASVSCSKVHPCFDIRFVDVKLDVSQNSTNTGQGSCNLIKPGGVTGITGPGCQ
ncbi:putative glycosyl hydrolases family 28 protein [Elsinoe australis]|uniref:galacturonan 1,4-alpha-galacturonidase n=1 Tax=Elsinoe australis TaxID=40998 RepID=A0A4U7B8X5_9PEZI|nr:putative glycosyl hydrolases family 28 protein [Elsinoe australis]